MNTDINNNNSVNCRAYSLVFSRCFIMVSGAVDLKRISVTLGTWLTSILQGTFHTHIHMYSEFGIAYLEEFKGKKLN